MPIQRLGSSGRTPLYSEVRRLMNQAARENTNPTRRTVVKAGGLAAASLALSKVPCLAASQPKIAIVGGGMAGLNAAYQLKQKGIASTVYEGSSRTGGRMFTARGFFGPGLTTEIGGEYIDTIHADMLSLCREFGLGLRDFDTKAENAYETTYFFGGSHRTEADVIAAFRPLAAAISADQKAFSFNDYTDYNQRAYELDNTSITDYLAQIGATGWVRDLLDVAYNIEFGLESDEQSSLNFLYLIEPKTNKGFQMYGESDERFTLKDGNDALTTALADEVSSQIRLGHRLVQVRSHGQGYRLTFDAPSGTVEVSCDIALITIPFSVLRDVDLQIPLSAQKQLAISELGYGTNAKLILGFNHRFWRSTGQSGEYFTDNGLQSGWDSSRLQGGSKGSLTFYSGGDIGVSVGQGSTNSQRLAALPLFDQMFPGAQSSHNGKALRFHWPTYPWSQGSYAAYRVGQYTQFSGAEFETEGRVFFAGEHCSSEFQGYMNGAAETGRRAAHRIARLVR